MLEQDRREFYTEYGKALDDRAAALFVGAGLSMPAGFKSWPALLHYVAVELGLQIDRETDLVALAQYHVNERRARGRLNQLLVDEFNRDVPLSENHRLIARLPIETVWTTNYDQLIERAYREERKRYDVKITGKNLGVTVRGKDVTIYKMHGDVTLPDQAVLTKEDYELYATARTLFSTALRGDLVNKTFLFLGFSFTDANIDYILSRIRVLLDEDVRQHYCLMKWPDKPKKGASAKARAEYDYELRRLELRVGDLKRYGIQTLRIDGFAEITDILCELNQRAHRSTVFVSGSAHDFSPMDEPRMTDLASRLGHELIRNGFNLVSGFGLGIGGSVLLGAMDEVYRDEKAVLSDRVIMRPFPQLDRADLRRQELYTKYRRDILSNAGATILLAGNRLNADATGTELAPGVLEEFDITKRLGKFPIPIGATGSAAQQIWREVTSDLTTFFPKMAVKSHFNVLGDPSKSNEELVTAVIAIMKLIVRA